MRIIVYIFLSILLGVLKMNAQEASSESEASNEISFSFNGDLSFSGPEDSYFSTSDSDDTFKVRAKFHERKTAKVRAYLLEELGTKNRTTNGDKQQWKVSYNGDTGYEVQLDKGMLRIFLDKEVTSSQLFNKFRTITRNIKNYTSGKSEENREEARIEREEKRLEREAEQLIREAERKMREAERLQREAERMKREAQRKTGH